MRRVLLSKKATDISSQAVRNQIAEAQKVASGGGSEIEVAEAKIELEVSFKASEFVVDRKSVANTSQVLESLQASLK